jgi:hypothetical protein
VEWGVKARFGPVHEQNEKRTHLGCAGVLGYSFRAVAFTIVLRLFIFHNGRDDTTGFLPRQPNIWYAGETLGTIYGG